MGQYISWEFNVQPVTPELVNELEHELEWYDCEGELFNNIYTAFFCTTSINALNDIENVMRLFTLAHPEITAVVYVQGESDECPDKWVFRKGKKREYTGEVVYNKLCEANSDLDFEE